LVTGVSGFIGPKIASTFEASGWRVVAVDKCPPSDEKGRSFHQLDLAEPGALAGLLGEIDVICHLAGTGDLAEASRDPSSAFRNNVDATYEVVRSAAAAGVPRVIVASSWHVYGDGAHQTLDETSVCHPRGPYARSKFNAELLALQTGKNLDVEVVALRLGTAYGSGMRPKAVIRAMIESAAASDDIEVTAGRETFRQFTHLGDIATAFELASGDSVHPGVYNVVSDEVVRIHDLARTIAARFGVQVREIPHNDVIDTFLISSERFRRCGWRPQIPFAAGLEEAISVYGRTFESNIVDLSRSAAS
jgi:nucleoside-diphosphate-sugar epimerase